MAPEPADHPAEAPATAQMVAMTWVGHVMDGGDLAAAWPLTDPTLRLVLAQDWIWSHRHHPLVGHDADWDRLAAGLSSCPPAHDLWSRFAGDQVELWHRIWKGFSAHAWATLDHPEVLALDLEVVTFVETGGDPSSIQTGRHRFARRFALRHAEAGWAVASVNGEHLFLPGWPPSLEDQTR